MSCRIEPRFAADSWNESWGHRREHALWTPAPIQPARSSYTGPLICPLLMSKTRV